MTASPSRLRDFAAWIPLLVAVLFVLLYALPTPLTDDWLLLRNAAIVHDMGWAHPRATVAALTWKIYQHPLILPNFVYLMLGPLVAFDARVFIGITLACFAAILAVFRSRISSDGLVVLPLALVLFSPSHYMEMVWGFQFAMALSIALPVLGLALMDRARDDASGASYARHLAGALALVTAGVLSSAGGAFAFASLALLCACKPHRWPLRAAGVVAGLAALGLAVWILSGEKAGERVSTIADGWKVFTGLGAVLLGSGQQVPTASLGLSTLVGGCVVASMATATAIALLRGGLGRIALPLALFSFGLLVLVAIAIGRDYLGNWHLQVALPAIVGMYGAAVVVAREWPTLGGRALQGFASVLLLLSLFGYVRGYSKHGPEYHEYALSIRAYMDGYLANPEAAKPFPVTGGWDYDERLARFFARYGTPTR